MKGELVDFKRLKRYDNQCDVRTQLIPISNKHEVKTTNKKKQKKIWNTWKTTENLNISWVYDNIKDLLLFLFECNNGIVVF